MATKNKLAEALTTAGAPSTMIDAALHGEYDDFESKSATPINDLVRDCRRAGLHELATRAMNGEFDGTKEESQAWFEREGKDLLERN
jgi:hypothetical protein